VGVILSHPDSAAGAVQPAGFLRRSLEGQKQRRALGLGLAIIIEVLLIALLMLVGSRFAGDGREAPEDSRLEAVTFALPEPAEETPPDEPSEPETAATPPQSPPVPQPPVERPVAEPERPPPILSNPVPVPAPPPPAAPAPAPTASQTRPVAPPRNYGPVDSGPQGEPDSQRVGTAPNGEPLFAARWYREPTQQELAGYLSTASAPSAALIACRTVADFRVEDCELLAESPAGSNIGRAVLAAAWQFRVRPARVGGKSQVGSWVRIRIDYSRTGAR
jgi:periplasmic protein TonB